MDVANVGHLMHLQSPRPEDRRAGIQLLRRHRSRWGDEGDDIACRSRRGRTPASSGAAGDDVIDPILDKPLGECRTSVGISGSQADYVPELPLRTTPGNTAE